MQGDNTTGSQESKIEKEDEGSKLNIRIPSRLDNLLSDIAEYDLTAKPELVREILREHIKSKRKDPEFRKWWRKIYGKDSPVLV